MADPVAKKFRKDTDNKTEKNESLGQIIEFGYHFRLDLTYDVVRLIFKFLNGKDLSSAGSVCRCWRDAAINEFKTRGPSYLRTNVDTNNALSDHYMGSKIVDSLRIKPKLGIFFTGDVESSIFDSLKVSDCYCSQLPPSCDTLMLRTYGAVLDEIELDKNDIACVFVPIIPKMKIKTFSIDATQGTTNRKNMLAKVQDWIAKNSGFGKNETSKCVMVFSDGENYTLATKILESIKYKTNPKSGIPLFLNDVETLKNSEFSPSKKTKFITHGWKSSALSTSQVDMKNAYLEHGDFNVFLVDWQPLAASTFYLGPMRNTEKVGQDAGQFIDFLIRVTGLNPQFIHFIGHSLGAHVAGNAGSATRSGRIGRVTGLDPALPGFHIFTTKKERLDPTDANFVDVIHSCGGVLGFLKPLGHVDFYPNAGTAVQPGCCCVPEVMEACSHGRSYAYYTESINAKNGLLATRCSSWDQYINRNCDNEHAVHMGEHVDQSAAGSYFLKTRGEAPFAYVEDVDNKL
ncbi:inactive pancreatic lipase-related protein 1-like [Belonocnema kinseyi]|uniref:inactive pancreatic lipase-related protein 1-like n=1 Tax=Belonocnema kinseyi TaxID=2817044 RepID=UPI00143DF9A8|nr:inactive pancreatic lipase-related protein 1-like [Belonocnema kinseyi]